MKKSIYCCFLIVLAVVFSDNITAGAATISAKSCNMSHVQEAINSATTGDTIVVPPGNCTWAGAVSITAAKKIILIGAGMDLTVITMSPLGYAVNLTASGSRLSGFGFINGAVAVDGEGWRIDHCKSIFNTYNTGIIIRGNTLKKHPIGLIDNCIFNNSRVAIGFATLMNNDIWSQPLGLGTNNAVFVEDCVFNGVSDSINAIDSNYGGRYIFRFNTVNDQYLEAHTVQAANRAARSWEIYNNTINQVTKGMWVSGYMRGGTGVIFNNTLTGTWTAGWAMDNGRSCASATVAGQCDGSSPWDGTGTYGYPCRDQIGRSTDDWLWTAKNPYPTQTLDPAYIFNNKKSKAEHIAFTSSHCAVETSQVQENRDYYNYNASFNGSSGIGVGILANRPKTCTKEVAYWATDQGSWNKSGKGGQGVLYKCTATDTWELYYTPYTYPHPLSKLNPPQKLRISN